MSFILKDENAVFYECGYSCDNEIFISHAEKNFFITDARYGIEAAEIIKNAEIIISNDINQSAKELIKKLGISRLELNPHDFSLADFKSLSNELGDIFDFKPNFSQIKRMIKSKDEIEILKTAAKHGADGFKRVCEFVKSSLDKGISECELNYEVANILKNKGEFGLSFEPITALNANAAKAHALPTKNTLKNGDLLLFDAGIKYRRYCSDRTRTFEVGQNCQVSKEQNFKNSKRDEIYHIVLEAQQMAIKAVRAGVRACDIDKAARDFIAKAGYGEAFFHSTGHGVGLDIHELPRISPKSEEIIKPGMVFSIEPGIYLQGEFGVRIEDVVVATENGCEIL